jgi:hypothetical protein
LKKKKLVVEVLKDMVEHQPAIKIWASANQLLHLLTNGREGQGAYYPKFFDEYKERIRCRQLKEEKEKIEEREKEENLLEEKEMKSSSKMESRSEKTRLYKVLRER